MNPIYFNLKYWSCMHAEDPKVRIETGNFSIGRYNYKLRCKMTSSTWTKIITFKSTRNSNLRDLSNIVMFLVERWWCAYIPDVGKVNSVPDKCLSKCADPSAHSQPRPRLCSWGQHPPASQWMDTPPVANRHSTLS